MLSSVNSPFFPGYVDGVYIPPDPDVLTDEENFDDEGNLCEVREPKDIAGTFELQYVSGKDFPDETQVEDSRNRTKEDMQVLSGQQSLGDDSSDDETLASIRKKLIAGKLLHQPPDVDWKKGEIIYTHSPTSVELQDKENLKNLYGGLTPLEIFFLFFDDEVVNLVLEFTLKYASDNNRHSFSLQKEELLGFVGILLLSGYHTLPQTRLYWSNDEDKGVDVVKNCMSRNRFQSIKRNLHLSDNEKLDKSDKFSKVRPFLNMLNKKNMQFGIFVHSLSIDEQMVPYFGRHSCKMFLKGKPVRFGFKIWCLCSSEGYLFYSLPYAGQEPNKKFSSLGLGGDVVLNSLSVVVKPINHQIFFDNFFSSFKLFVHLKNNGFFATGTIRDNRLFKCPLEETKSIGKKVRGTYAAAYDKLSNVSILRWNDNSVVTVASNTFGVEPIGRVKRFDRKKKVEKFVPQPYVISQYNKYMGGVDLHDNGIANYRCKVLGKKWWWPIFIIAIDSLIL